MAERVPLSLPPERPPARAGAWVRPKTTPRRVVWVDRFADWAISIGGLAVILAVFGIMAFLVDVVVPLFRGASVEAEHRYEVPAAATSGRPLALVADEYDTVALELSANGAVRAFHLPSGRALAESAVDLGPSPVTAFGRAPSGEFGLGFADGTVRFGTIGFDVSLTADADAPPALADLGAGDATDGTAVYQKLPGGQTRRIAPRVELLPADPAAGAEIRALDVRIGGSVERPTRSYVTVDAAGSLTMHRTESRMNLLTHELTETASRIALPAVPNLGEVAGVLLPQLGKEVFLAERDGTVHRFDLRNPASPVLAESTDLVPGDAALASIAFLIGDQSLVVGGGDGSVAVWFSVERNDAGTTDGRALVLAHALEPQPAAILAIAPSQRGKLFATSDAAGGVFVRHATSEQVLLRLDGGLGGPAEAAALSPRDDGVLAWGDARAAHWRVHAPHPETTLGTIFGRVWYEGYPEPGYTWQSSSGTDLFEPKLSLVPLIYGTLKATFYSLLFAIPIALAAAVYTSEFLHPRLRAAVKPTMEMMASLPSVVLGFIAALVLAPWVEPRIASLLLALFAIPVALLVAAYLWQLLPQPAALRLEGVPKLAMMFAAVALGTGAAWSLGPAFERAFFGGDLRQWLTGSTGGAAPLLFLLLLPLAYGVVAVLVARGFGGAIRARIRALDRSRAGAFDGAVWVATFGAGLLLAGGAALLLAAIGLDPRGGVVGTYVQRNTLVVGFAMGFAVIPIVYTIAEDAMSAVPSHLRAASLGCGATPWQTAVSIVIPTAMSGVFAAIMIGMGRAVGETMIVVMAAGNTPILDWNVFNGLRALSANIAVELPEAVKDGSLYRMLFLAALVLFAMTFAVNTLAEVVRQRFRKRAAEL
jgi:phosphate transport system permease protein